MISSVTQSISVIEESINKTSVEIGKQLDQFYVVFIQAQVLMKQTVFYCISST